jgi:hypothetical protein
MITPPVPSARAGSFVVLRRRKHPFLRRLLIIITFNRLADKAEASPAGRTAQRLDDERRAGITSVIVVV